MSGSTRRSRWSAAAPAWASASRAALTTLRTPLGSVTQAPLPIRPSTSPRSSQGAPRRRTGVSRCTIASRPSTARH
nr:unnamed protein product [Callosobruchus chinensis]